MTSRLTDLRIQAIRDAIVLAEADGLKFRAHSGKGSSVVDLWVHDGDQPHFIESFVPED